MRPGYCSSGAWRREMEAGSAHKAWAIVQRTAMEEVKGEENGEEEMHACCSTKELAGNGGAPCVFRPASNESGGEKGGDVHWLMKEYARVLAPLSGAQRRLAERDGVQGEGQCVTLRRASTRGGDCRRVLQMSGGNQREDMQGRCARGAGTLPAGNGHVSRELWR